MAFRPVPTRHQAPSSGALRSSSSSAAEALHGNTVPPLRCRRLPPPRAVDTLLCCTPPTTSRPVHCPTSRVEEVMDDKNSKADMHVEYMVQFPVSSDDVEEVLPTPPLRSEDTLRFSTRNVQNMEDKIQDRAVAIPKKRNLEGLMKQEDAVTLRTGGEKLKENASRLMRICATAYQEEGAR
ncbi:uncharacterized protein LOC119332892 [Triticum dicoccoides]|uniref:uncharacterized protein LOC119332892 n=1 Tax=Triticum dicoccoides TaxID=85692 RepID=UPI001890CFAA|nr:uncharacterized protein LOC119332892 [Triticum dicoccoides]